MVRDLVGLLNTDRVDDFRWDSTLELCFGKSRYGENADTL